MIGIYLAACKARHENHNIVYQDFKIRGVRINNDGYNQGGSNVAAVIEKWLNHIEGEKDEKKN